MTKPEDALPVVAWLYIDRRDAFQYATNACGAETLPGAEPLAKRSDALSALTLVQQERDELRAALQDIADLEAPEIDHCLLMPVNMARAALTPKATPTSEASRDR